MAALSSRNFLAPFQNKLQLGTIIILATLVALFRLSNGDLSTQPRRGQPAQLDTSITIDKQQRARPAQRQDSDPFADILNEQPAPSKPNQAAPAPNNLSDVRKALGLE